MYDKVVGMDVLPNVYLDRIFINSDTTIGVRLKMFDYDQVKSWRDREFANNLEINIMCCLVNDEQGIESLNFGNTMLHQYYSDLSGRILSCNADFEESDRDDRGSTYTCYVEFDLRTTFVDTPSIEEIENLNVYVSTYVDGFDFVQEEYQSVFGALFGEKILENNQIITESGHFFFQETGEEYSGPVHIHPDSMESEELIYMEGSTHSSNSHRYVYYYQEENFKIIDLRGVV